MFRDLKPREMKQKRNGALITSTPEGWTTVRLAQVGILFKGKGGSREDDAEVGVACIRYGDLYKHNDPRFNRVRTRVAPNRVSAYTKITRGDIMFALSGESIEDIGKSAVCLLDEVTVCGGDSAVFRPNTQVNPEFAAYVLDSPRVGTQKIRAGRGDIIVHISAGALKQLTFDLPPLPEQAAIVKYLGHAHARIDRAIAAKRKLIALLEEQKQAIVNQAVTRGLDPTVPMTDSGIPWLGQIPAHWGIRKLGWLFRTQGSGTTPPRDDQYGGDVPWIMSGDLNNGRIAVTKKTVTRDAVSELSSLRVYAPGALVVAMYGATIGKNAVTNVAAATNQACCVFAAPREGTQVEYVQLVMTAGRAALAERGVGGGQPNVNAQIVKQFRVPSPPVEEQVAIVAACSFEALRTGRIAEKTLKEIEFLHEFRASLTSDVVTGQLDVREIASRLPDVVEDTLVDADSDEDESFVELEGLLEEADA